MRIGGVRGIVLLSALWLTGGTCTLQAQEAERPAPPALPETEVVGIRPAFEPTVGAGAAFGDIEAAFDAPGSGAYLDSSAINTQSYDNVERVLSLVPGVYFRTENGYGHFPSISLRGVDTTRSAKVTVMEDGILSAPAPYSSAAAYYAPNVGRMHAVEVIKGHSQVLFGPHTTGGAINFISTPIPEKPTAYARALYGDFDEYRIHTYFGGTTCTKWGRVGYLLEGYLRETDGFKTLMQTPAFRTSNPFSSIGNTRATGFTDSDVMLKVFWEPNTCTYTRWEAKVGYGPSDRNETYLGLATGDFLRDPYLRYPASRFDNFTSEHTRSYLRFTAGDLETDALSITNTVYYNRFHRNWYKLHELRDIDTDGDGTPDGVNMNLGSATTEVAEGGAGLAVLRGEQAGTWRVRANNRFYYSYGNEFVIRTALEGRHATHDVIAGLRYHVDEINPFQHNDDFTIDGQGFITATAFGAPGSQRNREQETHATACYVQDAITLGRLVVTPGIRFEHMDMSTVDFNGDDIIYTATLDVVAGGVGVTYDVSDRLKFLAGFHRGFSPPSPRGATGQGPGGHRLEEEESLASEFGFRYLNAERAFGAQLIVFYTHFNDLIVIDNIGGAGTGDDENVGKVFSSGVEFSVQYDMGKDRQWGFDNPWYLVATYTNARLLNDVNSANPSSLFAGGKAGNWIPYIPEWTFTMGTGVHFDLAGVDVRGIFVDDTYTTASNTTSETRPDGVPDSRFGKTDSYFIWDFSGYARLTEKLKLFGGIQNAFSLRYLASRHPYGPRPGAPLFAYMGLEGVY